MFEWGYAVAGFFVGVLVGLTGVGGGSLMTPLLIFLFNINPAIAVGTDLLFAAITKAGGIWTHHRKQHVEWGITGLLALGSLPTALVCIIVLGSFQDKHEALSNLITFTLGIALMLTAVAILLRSHMQAFGQYIKRTRPVWRERRNKVTILAGVVLGLLVPITSVGAGALGAAMLMFLYPSLPMRKIVGTDLAHAVPLTLIAGLGHFHLGSVDLGLLAVLLIGSLPGIYLGSHASSRVPEMVMRPILAGMLMLIGMKFVLG